MSAQYTHSLHSADDEACPHRVVAVDQPLGETGDLGRALDGDAQGAVVADGGLADGLALELAGAEEPLEPTPELRELRRDPLLQARRRSVRLAKLYQEPLN